MQISRDPTSSKLPSSQNNQWKSDQYQILQFYPFENLPFQDDGMNCMGSVSDSKCKRIKKDALWKPLLREFKNYYRTLLSQTL